MTSLDLQSNRLGLEGGKAIASALTGNAVLTSIDVGYNRIGKEQVLSLVSIFKEKDQMKSVGLAGCNLGVDGAEAVADYVSGSAVLKSIDLSSNQLCGVNPAGNGTYDLSGIQALAAALGSGSAVLTNLNLAHNALCGVSIYGRGTYDPSGIQALAAAIGSGRAVLKSIDLRNNFLERQQGVQEVQEMQDALKGRSDFKLQV